DVLVVDAQRHTLAEQGLRKKDDRALAQVVGAGLEAEPEQADLFPAGLEHLLDRQLDLPAVAPPDLRDHRPLEGDLLRPVLKRADVLRQTGSAERKPRLQIIR